MAKSALPNGPFLRNVLDLAQARCLQPAQAVACRLFGILIALPFILGLQARPFVGVHRLDIGSLELAAGCGLGRKQRRIGPADAQFCMLRRLRIDARMRNCADTSWLDISLSHAELAVSRSAATACS